MPTEAAVVDSLIEPWAVQSRIGPSSARYALNGWGMPVPNESWIDYRSGVFASGDDGGTGHMAMKVQPGTGLNVTVEMGNAQINTAQQGAYMCALDSKKTLPIAASSSTTNRIDLIIGRVYDDENSAINSTTGTRKFSVEVYQGDPVTGTASAPTPNFAGYIPLAAVAVNQNATSITAANITDWRGPGLVARGGMRGLYGGDALIGSTALNEPGAYPGDQRWVHTDGFQHQVYYGNNTDPDKSGWHGVHNCLVYNANPAPGETWWVKGPPGTVKEFCRLTIPYSTHLGVPFMLYPSARAYLTISPGVAVDVRITTDDVWGHAISWQSVHNLGAPGDSLLTGAVAPMMFGPLDYDVDVILNVNIIENLNGNDYGFGYRGNDTGMNLLSVCVYPSTVQPPSATGVLR